MSEIFEDARSKLTIDSRRGNSALSIASSDRDGTMSRTPGRYCGSRSEAARHANAALAGACIAAVIDFRRVAPPDAGASRVFAPEV